MTGRTRIILGVTFVVLLMVCGLAAGTFIGGRLFVPRGSGLAGPMIALGYGLLGAVAAGLLGGFLAWKLPEKWFLRAAVPVTLVGGVLVIVIAWLYVDSTARHEAHLEQAYERLNKFRVTMAYTVADGAPFHRMEADWGTRRYTVDMGTDGARSCTAELSGREAVALLGALREVEGIVLKQPKPCAGLPGAVERELDWVIPEIQPPDSGGTHAVTAACAARYPGLDRPFAAAARILRDGDHERVCR